MEKVYYKAIDVMKIVCAILVVCVHTGPLLSINEEMNFFLVQVLARCAVPFFFLSSAFFLFKKIDLSVSLKAKKNLDVLKKYVVHIAKMYGFWTLFYLPIQLIIWIVNGFSLHSILLYIRDFFFRGSYYHLWFLPALLFAVVFVYFLLTKIKEKEVWKISLVLYGIGMLINVYGDVLVNIPLLGVLINVYLKLFATSRNGLFFGCIYVVMGYMLAKKEFIQNAKSLYPKWILSFVLLVCEVYFILKLGCMNDLTCMYIMLLPFVYSMFEILLSFTSLNKGNSLLRNSSTLLYVVHCFFTFVLQYINFIYAHSFVYFMATLICSFMFIIVYLRLAHKWKWLRSVI